MKDAHKFTNLLIAASVLVAVSVPAWKYVVAKDFYLTVEAACDPSQSTCHFRDCSNEDDCPIGELEYFTPYRVHASEYDRCLDGTCGLECSQGALQCEEVVCGDESEYECSLPEEFSAEEGESEEREGVEASGEESAVAE